MFNNGHLDGSCPAVFAAFNPLNAAAEFRVGGDLDSFSLIADIENFNQSGLLCDAPISGGVLKLPPLSMVLMVSR